MPVLNRIFGNGVNPEDCPDQVLTCCHFSLHELRAACRQDCLPGPYPTP